MSDLSANNNFLLPIYFGLSFIISLLGCPIIPPMLSSFISCPLITPIHLLPYYSTFLLLYPTHTLINHIIALTIHYRVTMESDSRHHLGKN